MQVRLLVRRCVPESLINAYHYLLAQLAAFLYRYPSRELIVIGVTGTNGKSSTVQFIGRLLEQMGQTVGWTTTVGFKVANEEWINDKKMTMLGRFQTQRLLRRMVRAGCAYAIVETSSQGIAQSRHVGIAYDVCVFTNLTPEHIEAHGGFESYKHAKGQLFSHLSKLPQKIMLGMGLPKITIVNAMDEHTPYFLSFHAGEPWGFSYEHATKPGGETTLSVRRVRADHVSFKKEGTHFEIQGIPFSFQPFGRFNFENVFAAITTCRALGYSLEHIRRAVATLAFIPGRLEMIDEGQPFTVVVDYAPEPVALSATYEALALLPYERMIHVLGSTGGGRDVSRRAKLGGMAAERASVVLVTNEDPYDDDPMQIIDDVAEGAVTAGKKEGVDLFRILDRQEAIEKAIGIAQKGDLVLITGKGCEPVMAIADGKKIPWDDRKAARQALHKHSYETAV